MGRSAMPLQLKVCRRMAERKPAEPAHPVGYREARRVGWGPNEFTSVGRGGACLPDDKVKELSNFRQLLSPGFDKRRRRNLASNPSPSQRRRDATPLRSLCELGEDLDPCARYDARATCADRRSDRGALRAALGSAAPLWRRRRRWTAAGLSRARRAPVAGRSPRAAGPPRIPAAARGAPMQRRASPRRLTRVGSPRASEA